MKKISLFIIFSLILNLPYSLAFDVKNIKNVKNAKTIKAIKEKFKKKEPEPKERMVETRDEYDIKATNIPLEERVLPNYSEPVSTKTYYYPPSHYVFEKFNYPQGKREVNIESIKKDLSEIPYFVADNKVKYAAYTKYFFSPSLNQISSNFYVEKLDENLSKIDRIINFKEQQKERKPIIEAGTKMSYKNLFNGLTVVDWNKNSTTVLVKEKIGSTYGGIYKTHLYLYSLPTEIKSAKLVRLDEVDEAIKYYFDTYNDVQLIKYRYDIEPVGFSEDNDNIIIVCAYVYDKNDNKMFLGTWGYNVLTSQTLLFSKTEQNQSVSANGLILRRSID